jgi:hypothetical protein
MTELPPMHQIFAVKDRNTRKILEAARDQVIVRADSANARVGVEAGKDWISIELCQRRPAASLPEIERKRRPAGENP